MRSADERLLRMHTRAAEIRRQREQTAIRILGVLSGALTVCLIFVMHKVTDVHQALISGNGTGSSLLSESAGGYILIAVAAFFAGAMITVIAVRYRKQGAKEENEKRMPECADM